MDRGKVKFFNGRFGFIETENSSFYFNVNSQPRKESFNKGDIVTFKAVPSRRKPGQFEAASIRVIERVKVNTVPEEPDQIGKLDWFAYRKGYGVIQTFEGEEYFLHKSNFYSDWKYLQKGTILVFTSKKEKRNEAISCFYPGESREIDTTANSDPLLLKYVDYYVELCIAGVVKKPNTKILAKKLVEETRLLIDSQTTVLFKKLDSSLTRQLTDEFIDTLEKIDSDGKYQKVKQILLLNSSQQEDIALFVKKVYHRADTERKYLMWLDGYTDEKDLTFIAKKIAEQEFRRADSSLNRIFEKLLKAEEQKLVLEKFLALVVQLDSQPKYDRFKAIVELAQLDELAKTKFIQIAIEQADAERRYSMWLDGYTDEKDYKLIARKIGEEEDIWFKSSIYDIFKRLPEPQEQGLVLKEVALLTGTLDSQFKYDRYKAIVKLSHLDELVKNKFKQIAFQQADTERKYLMWLDGYTDEKDSTFISKKIVEAEFRGGDSSLNKIFEKLVQAEEQLQVLDKFSALIGRLDSQPKYEHFKAIVGLPHLYEPVRNKFKQIAVEQADAERKYLMWLDGYTEIKDLSYIIQKLSSEIHANYSSYLERNIRRIDSSTEKQYILKNLLSNTAKVDNSDKYVQFKAILNHLEGRNKYDCIQSVFSAADNERKYLIWLDGLIDHIDLELIATHFAKENSEDDYRVYEKVFSKISDPIDQLFTLNQLIVQLESIDSDRKINLVRSILSCVNVNKYVKNKFRSDSILIASTGYIFKLIIQVVGGFQKSKVTI